MKISIIIPNWNGENKLKRNLPRVLDVQGVDEIIVVDDCSTDDSINLLKNQFPSVRLIQKDRNSGFSSTVNLGVKNAEGEIVVLLNTDATPQRDFITRALPHFKDPKVFSVSCNVGGAWAVGEFKRGFFWHHQAEFTKEDLKKSHRTLWASGGSGIFRKSIWEQLGGFDELFNPFYEEDLDLGYRASKRGYINIWEPSSVVEHYKEKGVIEANFSKDYVARTAQRNQLYFIWKNITDQDLINEHKDRLIKMLLTQPGYWPVFISAFINIGAVLRKRHIEVKEVQLSDKELFTVLSK